MKSTARKEEKSMEIGNWRRMSAWEANSGDVEDQIIERLRNILKFELRQMKMGEANFWKGQDQNFILNSINK